MILNSFPEVHKFLSCIAMNMATPISPRDPDLVLISFEIYLGIEFWKMWYWISLKSIYHFINHIIHLSQFLHILAKMCCFLPIFVYSSCPNGCEILSYRGFDLHFLQWLVIFSCACWSLMKHLNSALFKCFDHFEPADFIFYWCCILFCFAYLSLKNKCWNWLIQSLLQMSNPEFQISYIAGKAAGRASVLSQVLP